MRVGLLSHNARFGDALGNQIAARARFFHQRGDDVQVWIECDRRLQPALRGKVQILSDRNLDQALDELRQTDCLIVHFTQDYRALDLLPKLADGGPRILFDYYGVTPPEYWDGPAEQLRAGQDRRSLVWYADAAIVHSRFMRDELCRATGFPEQRVHLVPLWFQPPETDAGPTTTRSQLWEIPDHARLILFVGRLAPNKRLPVLIEALSRLRQDDPPVHLLVIGDSGEIYRHERERCEQRAATLHLVDRIHWRGRVGPSELASAYRHADVFVLPSVHEGCGLPVREAMAAGLPVIVARSSALPETMAGAGLSFTPDDPDDLARQIRRALSRTAPRPSSRVPPKIAVIAPDFGFNVVGGAEQSLRLIAQTLASEGAAVEVFSTDGTEERLPGFTLHRFPKNRPSVTASSSLSQRIEFGEATWQEFVDATRHSDRLLAAWATRCHEFDAAIVGPYSCGLTWEVVRQCPEQVLLLPCFHDEVLAHRMELRELCQIIGGILYHSAAERRLAELSLGIHHPNTVEVGTYLPAPTGDPERGRHRVRSSVPYLLYAGRACKEKNFHLLLEWFRNDRRERGSKWELVLTGDARPGRWDDGIRCLGRLDPQALADVIAGAACLVQLSTRESLSLASLSAWNHGVPVLAHRRCEVLRDFIDENGGGQTVADESDFRTALDDLLRRPEEWRRRGRLGQQAVQARYGSRETWVGRLTDALRSLHRPLAEVMRDKGRQVTAQTGETAWSQTLMQVIQHMMTSEPRPPTSHRVELQILPMPGRTRPPERLNLRVVNQGTVPLWPHSAQIVAESGNSMVRVNLHRVVHPGQSAVVRVAWPTHHASCPDITVHLDVEGRPVASLHQEGAMSHDHLFPRGLPTLHELQQRLERAASLSQLPVGYVDVSEGWLAGVKRWIKRKILGQFQAAYVDVMARQQSALNRALVEAIRDIADQLADLADTLAEQNSKTSRAGVLSEDRQQSTKSEGQPKGGAEPPLEGLHEVVGGRRT